MTAHLSENILKFLIYFKPTNSYWNLTPASSWKHSTFPIGRYPLDMIQRLKTGHYYRLDEKGLPIMVSVYNKFHGKKLIHYYTTLSSFAFAHWDLYLLKGLKSDTEIVLNVANYMIETGVVSHGNELLLKCENELGEHEGDISAMDQGMSLSVFARAWLLSNDRKYLDYGYMALKPFTKSIEEGGVVGHFSKISGIWYEENIQKPLHHILNGKIYALWGILDFYKVTKDKNVKKLFDQGVSSLGKALKYFDNGFWSWYWYPEDGKDFYIASMMYQNLHLCQLKALYYQTGEKVFEEYSNRFERYARNPLNRLKAGLLFALYKIRKIR